jgi:hypothetical protein
MLARGQYATIRSEHEECKKRLQMLTGQMSSLSSQILKGAQPADESQPIDVLEQIAVCHKVLENIDRCVMLCTELAKQRAELRPIAWPR